MERETMHSIEKCHGLEIMILIAAFMSWAENAFYGLGIIYGLIHVMGRECITLAGQEHRHTFSHARVCIASPFVRWLSEGRVGSMPIEMLSKGPDETCAIHRDGHCQT